MPNDPTPAGHSFRNVDTSKDPAGRVRYLDAVREEADTEERSKTTRALMHLHEGSVALDAGCGAGDEVMAMAGIVGPSGRVVGIDNSAVMVEEARKRAAALGVNAEFHVGDLCALDFPNDTFDAAHTERVLIHVESPVAAIRELIRVTRPGGRIAVCEPDFGSQVVDAPDRLVRRKIHDWTEDKGIRNPWVGRQVRRLFLEEGVAEVSVATPVLVRVHPIPDWVHQQSVDFVNSAARDGYVTAAEKEAYLHWMGQAVEDGTWLSAILWFIVGGTVPEKK